jgi:hypothetical protein
MIWYTKPKFNCKFGLNSAKKNYWSVMYQYMHVRLLYNLLNYRCNSSCRNYLLNYRCIYPCFSMSIHSFLTNILHGREWYISNTNSILPSSINKCASRFCINSIFYIWPNLWKRVATYMASYHYIMKLTRILHKYHNSCPKFRCSWTYSVNRYVWICDKNYETDWLII